jgi:hypothetical protein
MVLCTSKWLWVWYNMVPLWVKVLKVPSTRHGEQSWNWHLQLAAYGLCVLQNDSGPDITWYPHGSKYWTGQRQIMVNRVKTDAREFIWSKKGRQTPSVDCLWSLCTSQWLRVGYCLVPSESKYWMGQRQIMVNRVETDGSESVWINNGHKTPAVDC